MKKLTICSIMFVAVMMLLAGSAFADVTLDDGGAANSNWVKGSGCTITDAGGGGTITVTLSPNVGVYYLPDGGTGDTYAATSLNSKGTKEYGVSSDYAGMMMKDITVTPLAKAVTITKTDASTAFNGWAEVGK